MNAHILATNVGSIFSLPDVVFRINSLIDSGEATNNELEQTVLHDPAITAKIMNNPAASYGVSTEI